MTELPTGTVTFLFTDIEGSTGRWERQPEAMRVALAQHDALIRAAIQAHEGHVVKTMGDAFHAAFARAPDGLAAALDAQSQLQAEPWGDIGPLRVRMALHTGVTEERGGDYYGPALNRAARILSAGHGGQVLLSQVTYELVRDTAPTGTALTDLGEHRLKDLIRPERIFQASDLALKTEFPPLRTLDLHPNNLPVQSAPLIGRERVIQEVSDLLARDDVRLVTLTGPGGIGKTRLALQVAAEMVGAYPEGVYAVELAPISDPGLVASEIAQTVSVMPRSDRPLLDSLIERLKNRRLLLLLDNFEQILAAASVVDSLLRSCPTLTIIVTSRAPLQIRSEHEFPVPPLTLPVAGRPLTAEALSQYEAVALFIERAAAIRPDFTVTNANAPAVAEICARLDGLPLAIELAAARIRLLPPEALLTRLGQSLDLLRGGRRDLPSRQQTLRSAIGWSFDLLRPPEQQLFRRLGVFIGGFTIEAVEAVCDPEGDLELDILDGMGSLVDASLVRRDQTVGGEPRFGMLETIREYAVERLEESVDVTALRRRHADYFTAWAQSAEPELRGPRQVTWLDRLQADHDNGRSALTWALDEDHAPQVALRLATALAWFWFIRGHLDDLGRLEAAIRACSVLTDDAYIVRTRARGLYMLAWIGRSWNDPPRTVALCEESVDLFRSINDRAGTAASLTELGQLLRDARDYPRARSVAEEGLAMAREVGDRTQVAFALYVLASNMFYVQFAGEDAEPTIISPRGIGRSKIPVVDLAGHHKRPLAEDKALALRLLEESLAIYRGLDDTYGITVPLSGGGGLTEWAWATGDYAGAEAIQVEALALRRRLKEPRGLVECLNHFAIIALGQQRPGRAARLAAAASHYAQVSGSRRLPVIWRTTEQEQAAIRAALSEAEFRAAWAEGSAMSLEEAIDYALGLPATSD